MTNGRGNYFGKDFSSAEGPLTLGPQCRVWNLRNGNVPCHCFGISHVDSKIGPTLISHVEFRKWPMSCH